MRSGNLSYVVAFNRNRDNYQVPLALHEGNMLMRLVTDIYCPDSAVLQGVFPFTRLKHRRIDGLPSARANWNFPAIFYQALAPRLGMNPRQAMTRVDHALSVAAAKVAYRTGADLFLYSGYAAPAFEASISRNKIKGLFVFHPLCALNRDILLKDAARHPECRWSLENERDTSEGESLRLMQNAEWQAADFIITASTFTARSLVYAGCSVEKITVVPYGCDTAAVPFDPALKAGEECRFIFVGQGVQRKGLHHLLKAWRLVGLKNARLTVLSSVLDPGIRGLAGEDVTVLGAQPRHVVLDLLARSHVFVMPSLVEGFGLVYLEALSAGCFVIGTDNTGLPDLGAPDTVASVIAPGNVEQLAAALSDACEAHTTGRIESGAIRAFAETKPWSAFRAAISLAARSKKT